jgi:hypothetical protein
LPRCELWSQRGHQMRLAAAHAKRKPDVESPLARVCAGRSAMNVSTANRSRNT